MRTFTYTITDKLGIHARPAGMLAKTARVLDSEITITKADKTAAASKLMALMALGAKCGDTLTITITGGDEEAAEKTMREFFDKNL